MAKNRYTITIEIVDDEINDAIEADPGRFDERTQEGLDHAWPHFPPGSLRVISIDDHGIDECADCGTSTAPGTPAPHVCPDPKDALARQYARDNLQTDELEIDADAKVSRADMPEGFEVAGCWVAAWVWVPDHVIEDGAAPANVPDFVEWDGDDPEDPETPDGYEVDYEHTELIGTRRFRAPVIRSGSPS